MTQTKGLKRALGLTAVTFASVGLIIGAGIYSVIGAAAGIAREGLWLSFVIGAVVAFLTALSYAELSTTFPTAGAEYVYARHALPRQRWAPFMIGFILTVAAAATAVTVALAFAGYLDFFVEAPDALVAFGLLAVCTAVIVAGISQSSWVNIAFTSVEIVGLLLVIALGASTAGFGRALDAPLHAGILGGAAIVFFVYLGFEEVANLAEETVKPGQTLPRAILLSLSVTTVLYVLVALAVVTLTTPEELAASTSPLSTAVAQRSPLFARVLAGIALFATANTALLTLLGGSRMLFGMARGGDFPAFFKQVLPKRQTPWVTTIAMLVVSALLLPLGSLKEVASVSSFAALVAFATVNVALIILRYRDPDRKRPFRVPFAIGRFPVLPALGALVCIPLLTQFDVTVYAAGLVIGVVGISMFLGLRLWWKPRK